MTQEQFARETRYQTIMAAARRMHRAGIYTSDELSIIDTMSRAKYRPIFGGLCVDKGLQSGGIRANMVSGGDFNHEDNYKN